MKKLCQNCNKEYSNRGKMCASCYGKNYYRRNKAQESARKAKYYQNNKEKIDRRCKSYSEKNKEKVKLKNRNHYHNNKEEILSYQKKYRITPKRKFGQGMRSAKERNLTWTIDFDCYVQLINKPCSYCNCSLENVGGVSLDRLDNSIGYEPSNVVPCCGKCNNIRNSFLSYEEMKVAMEAVLEYRKQTSQEPIS